MSTEDLTTLIGWKWDAFHITVALAILGRAWHAIRTNGGLVGIWKALVFGTNTPKEIKE